jgi:hypothetical protein
MGGRLNLPDGWRYKSTMLDCDLVIETKGLANIVPDVLSNMYQGCLDMYQGCLDGVNNFDP